MRETIHKDYNNQHFTFYIVHYTSRYQFRLIWITPLQKAMASPCFHWFLPDRTCSILIFIIYILHCDIAIAIKEAIIFNKRGSCRLPLKTCTSKNRMNLLSSSPHENIFNPNIIIPHPYKKIESASFSISTISPPSIHRTDPIISASFMSLPSTYKLKREEETIHLTIMFEMTKD